MASSDGSDRLIVEGAELEGVKKNAVGPDCKRLSSSRVYNFDFCQVAYPAPRTSDPSTSLRVTVGALGANVTNRTPL